jgi:hypothetical protein
MILIFMLDTCAAFKRDIFLFIIMGAASQVQNASSSTVYWGVTSSTSTEIATLVLPKMKAFTHIRTNFIALNVSSSIRFEIVPLVLI